MKTIIVCERGKTISPREFEDLLMGDREDLEFISLVNSALPDDFKVGDWIFLADGTMYTIYKRLAVPVMVGDIKTYDLYYLVRPIPREGLWNDEEE